MYADWFEDLRGLAGSALTRDMANGAEAYLQMWERASGIRTPNCRPQRFRVNARGLGRIRLGAKWEDVLRANGQPQQRDRAWTWCVRGPGSASKADVAELTAGGRVELAGSTALTRSADGVPVGGTAARLRGMRSVGGGLFARDGRSSSFVYAVSRGKVTAVAVATRALARNKSALRAAMARLLKARATQAKRTFVPNEAQQSARITGATFAGSRDSRVNQALAVLWRRRRPPRARSTPARTTT
jgi:hypothetical protein